MKSDLRIKANVARQTRHGYQMRRLMCGVRGNNGQPVAPVCNNAAQWESGVVNIVEKTSSTFFTRDTSSDSDIYCDWYLENLHIVVK